MAHYGMFTGVLNNEGEQLCECQVVLLICTQIHPVISSCAT